MKTKQIKKILICNRGEIALRVIQTCREMGIQTVTIFKEEERHLPHAYSGDESFCLGNGTNRETYLNQDLMLEIAQKFKADAIHPGYGFLSENAEFCRKVEKAGIIFIGPSAESMELMGDKKTSKIKIVELGVPSIPGYHGDNQEANYLLQEAKKMGFPVLIKASAGGGGKGMRIVEAESEFMHQLEGAKREALNAFSDDTVLIEKYIKSPRHIEVQVMSDQHGQHFHFFERECSIQRRYQKIVEESPSVALTPDIREAITKAATQITKGINYRGAGTVEFILDIDGKFYFLEMNTRLQVEHPVTEMVTGYDLVRLQIRVAQGEKLDFNQQDLKQTGHAIEVRLYAEDPDNDFLPSIGKIVKIGELKNVRNSRLDCGYRDGNEVTISFDPMLAKLIVWGRTREEAISKMQLALNDVLFLGVTTNRDYLKRILSLEEFKQGLTYTHFVKTYAEKLAPKKLSRKMQATALAAFLLNKKGSTASNSSHTQKNEQESVWNKLNGFRN